MYPKLHVTLWPLHQSKDAWPVICSISAQPPQTNWEAWWWRGGTVGLFCSNRTFLLQPNRSNTNTAANMVQSPPTRFTSDAGMSPGCGVFDRKTSQICLHKKNQRPYWLIEAACEANPKPEVRTTTEQRTTTKWSSILAPYVQQRITLSVYGFPEINTGSTEFTFTQWANLLTMLQQRKEMCVDVGVWLLTKRSSYLIRTKFTWNIQGSSHITLTDPSESPQRGNPEKNTNMFAFITRKPRRFPLKMRNPAMWG